MTGTLERWRGRSARGAATLAACIPVGSVLVSAAWALRLPRRRRKTAKRAASALQAVGTLSLDILGGGWHEEAVTPGNLSRRAPLLIDGQIYLTEDTFPVTSPATGKLVGLAPQVSAEQLEYAVVAADRAAAGWAAMRRPERCTLLQSCAALLREKCESLATLQTNESGRPITETRVEIMVAAASFDNAARLLRFEDEEEISDDGVKRVVVRRSPVGVVAVIAPWNAPIVLGWKPTSCALACGNTVVLKPAPQTPLTTLRIGELLRMRLPPGVLNVVVGSDDRNPKPGEVLTKHPMVRKVVFTGSTEVGSKVMEACAKDFKRILLELGGNDAAIIRADADIPATAEGVFKAAFFNNGQTCCAIKRIYVHDSIFQPFVDALAARARRACIGNGLTEGVELGPLANNQQLAHVTALVEDARRCGGKVLCGGGATAGPPGDEGTNTGLFYLPTIITGIREGTRLVDEEQFGPVVPVMPYRSDAEAIRRANGTSYGLGASVWGSDLAKANEMADKLKAGTVWVNRHCEFVRNAPFGGFGNSGIGRAGDIARDLAEYTELRTLVLAKLPKPPPTRAPPMSGVVVEGRARELLRQRLAGITSRPWTDPDAFEEAAKEAVRVFPFQPLELRKALQTFSERDGPACVLVRGFPTECSGGGVSSTSPPPVRKDDVASEALLMGATALLGAKAFAYRAMGGDLVHPLRQDCEGLFGWYRDGRTSPAFEVPRRYYRPEAHVPEFVAAFCVRVNRPLHARFVDFRALAAASEPQDLETLRRIPLTFYSSATGSRSEPVFVVSDAGNGSQGVPIIDLRAGERFEPEGAPEAVEAYLRLCQLAGEVCESFEMRPGDLVIFNNKRCVHSWSPIDPDGATWVQTVYASREAVAWPERIVP